MIAYGLVILVAAICVNGEDAYLPPYIKPCTYGEGLDTCVKQQIEETLPLFTKGIPELGVPSLDPVNLDDIVVDGNGLKLSLNKAQMHGLSTAQVTELKEVLREMLFYQGHSRDGCAFAGPRQLRRHHRRWKQSQAEYNELKLNLKDETFVLKFAANMSVTGTYVIDGRILILPVKGDGDCSILVDDIEVEISSKLTAAKGKRGDMHLKLITPNYKYQIGKTTFKFQNLFNGNKQLSDATHQFANENWQQLMDDLAPPVIKQIVRTCVKTINKFFNKVALSQLIVGYTPN